MAEKINLYKDGNDVIIVVKDCEASFLDVIKKLVGIEEPTEIPYLEPVASEEPPKIPEVKTETVTEEVAEEVKPEEVLEKVQEEKAEPIKPAEPVEPQTSEEVPEKVPEDGGLKCSKCGETISINKDGVKCQCGFSIKRVWSKKPLSDDDIKSLIKNRETPVYDDFIGRSGKFSAKVILNAKNSPEFCFGK